MNWASLPLKVRHLRLLLRNKKGIINIYTNLYGRVLADVSI